MYAGSDIGGKFARKPVPCVSKALYDVDKVCCPSQHCQRTSNDS